jgi:hypothetical protein
MCQVAYGLSGPEGGWLKVLATNSGASKSQDAWQVVHMPASDDKVTC